MRSLMLCKSVNRSQNQGSLEALHALYYRANFNDEEFKELVGPMYTEQSVDLCRNLLLHTTVDPEDIDLEKYQISKKLAEVSEHLKHRVR